MKNWKEFVLLMLKKCGFIDFARVEI